MAVTPQERLKTHSESLAAGQIEGDRPTQRGGVRAVKCCRGCLNYGKRKLRLKESCSLYLSLTPAYQ